MPSSFCFTAIGFNVETVTYKNLKFQGERKKSVWWAAWFHLVMGCVLMVWYWLYSQESINWVQIVFYCWFNGDSQHQAICQDFMMALNGNIVEWNGWHQYGNYVWPSSPSQIGRVHNCAFLVASAKFLVALATRKAQFRTLPIYIWLGDQGQT